jgi:Zn-finger nucleic acid-binding protein
MPYSTCCGAYSTMPEIDICPECRDHCDWEDEEELEEDIESDNQIEQNNINKQL